MIITIAGLPGSGKTTVAKIVAEHLGYEHQSMGDLRGEVALKHGMTMDELNEVGKTKDWAHREVDEYVEELGKTKDCIVVDTWIGFHLIPDSIKIFVTVDLDEAGKRVFGDSANRPDERNYSSPADATDVLRKRIVATDEGYQRLYGVSFLDESHYDFKIDSTDISPSDVAEKIIEFVSTIRA